MQPLSTGDDLEVCPPLEWKQTIDQENFEPLQKRWWTLFEDPLLDHLVDEAIVGNQDLWIACGRILEAKALAGLAFSNRLPRVNLNFSYGKQQKLITLEDFGSGSNNQRVQQGEWRFPFDLQYDLDLWGKYTHENRAACEKLLANQYGYTNLYLQISSEVVLQYLILRTLDEEIRYLEEAVSVRETSRDINQARVDVGLDPEIDLSRASLELAIAQQELEDSKRLRALTENALAILLGVPASSLVIDPGTLPIKNPCPPPGLPSHLLLRRPDIMEKNHLVLASLEKIGVAKADFFPQFSLTGSLGTVSPSLSSWFTWQSRFWAIGYQAAQVIFDAGRLTSQLKEKEALYTQQVAAFQRQVTLAFKEVEDALNEVHFRRTQTEAQEKAVVFATDTAYLARSQFNAGLINFLQVADAEKTELENKQLFIRLNGSQYLASVQLIKALGGGW